MQVMQMEYRIQKDSIIAEIIKRTGSERPNQNDHVPSAEISLIKLTFCGACIWITKLVCAYSNFYKQAELNSSSIPYHQRNIW